MKGRLLLLAFCAACCAHAQLSESFDDGNVSEGPAWSGNLSDWQVAEHSDVASGATGSRTLRLNVPTGSGRKYLSTFLPGPWGSEQRWSFWIGRRGQAATASNISYVWLWASEEEVTAASAAGYRIRFGDDNGGDEIVLERVKDGTVSAIITSAGSVANGLTDYGFFVQVSRSGNGTWQLFTSVLPAANSTGLTASDEPPPAASLLLQGSGTDGDFTLFHNGYVAVAAVHTSGAAARTGLEIDNIRVSFAVNGALPVAIHHLKAVRTKEGIRLSWVSEDEVDVTAYIVERLESGGPFMEWQQLAPAGDGGGGAYSVTDASAGTGLRVYRVKAVEKSGAVSYSRQVMIAPEAGGGLLVFPNPFRNGTATIAAADLPPGNYRITLVNAAGQAVWTARLEHAGGALRHPVAPGRLPPGGYYLRLAGPVTIGERLLVQE